MATPVGGSGTLLPESAPGLGKKVSGSDTQTAQAATAVWKKATPSAPVVHSVSKPIVPTETPEGRPAAEMLWGAVGDRNVQEKVLLSSVQGAAYEPTGASSRVQVPLSKKKIEQLSPDVVKAKIDAAWKKEQAKLKKLNPDNVKKFLKEFIGDEFKNFEGDIKLVPEEDFFKTIVALRQITPKTSARNLARAATPIIGKRERVMAARMLLASATKAGKAGTDPQVRRVEFLTARLRFEPLRKNFETEKKMFFLGTLILAFLEFPTSGGLSVIVRGIIAGGVAVKLLVEQLKHRHIKQLEKLNLPDQAEKVTFVASTNTIFGRDSLTKEQQRKFKVVSEDWKQFLVRVIKENGYRYPLESESETLSLFHRLPFCDKDSFDEIVSRCEKELEEYQLASQYANLRLSFRFENIKKNLQVLADLRELKFPAHPENLPYSKKFFQSRNSREILADLKKERERLTKITPQELGKIVWFPTQEEDNGAGAIIKWHLDVVNGLIGHLEDLGKKQVFEGIPRFDAFAEKCSSIESPNDYAFMSQLLLQSEIKAPLYSLPVTRDTWPLSIPLSWGILPKSKQETWQVVINESGYVWGKA